MKASEILESAIEHIENRGKLRDSPQGERSMLRAVSAFNALTKMSLTEREGWLFMVCLKMSRATAGAFHQDDYEDMAAYAALAGEE